jgi:hypothetical protein
MLRRLAHLAILAAVFLPGCASKECTLIGCSDSFEVRFTGATAAPGRYEIEVVADGIPSSCQVTLPHECGTPPRCSIDGAIWRLATSGCSVSGGEPQRVDGIVFQRAYAALDFVVRRDDVVVGGGSAQPSYKESQPNGPDCEPLCRQAPPIQTEIAP